MADASRPVYVGLTDFNGHRYVIEVPALGFKFAKNYASGILGEVRRQIVAGEPIDCCRVHANNRARMLVVFHGPVTIDIALDALDGGVPDAA